MKHLFFCIYFLAAAALIFYAGCDTPTAQKIDNEVIPDNNVSYNVHLRKVFETKCSIQGCHDDVSRAGSLSLWSWQAITSDPSIVYPGEPDNSRLVWTIDPKFTTPTPMPPLDAPVYPLTANQIKGIRTWIAEGAKNN